MPSYESSDVENAQRVLSYSVGQPSVNPSPAYILCGVFSVFSNFQVAPVPIHSSAIDWFGAGGDSSINLLFSPELHDTWNLKT